MLQWYLIYKLTQNNNALVVLSKSTVIQWKFINPNRTAQWFNSDNLNLHKITLNNTENQSVLVVLQTHREKHSNSQWYFINLHTRPQLDLVVLWIFTAFLTEIQWYFKHAQKVFSASVVLCKNKTVLQLYFANSNPRFQST